MDWSRLGNADGYVAKLDARTGQILYMTLSTGAIA